MKAFKGGKNIKVNYLINIIYTSISNNLHFPNKANLNNFDIKNKLEILIFLSAFFQNFFLRQYHLSGDVPPHLAQPNYAALGRVLIWGL